MNNSQYLQTFFKEKEIPFRVWEIEDQDGRLHLISNDVVIEAIQSAFAKKKQIANTIRQIDFCKGDVNHFLKFLAGALVDGYCR